MSRQVFESDVSWASVEIARLEHVGWDEVPPALRVMALLVGLAASLRYSGRDGHDTNSLHGMRGSIADRRGVARATGAVPALRNFNRGGERFFDRRAAVTAAPAIRRPSGAARSAAAARVARAFATA